MCADDEPGQPRARCAFYADTESADGCDLLRCLVFKRDHRVQLLHHATVTSSSHVIYTAATERSIMFTVVVRVSETLRAEYSSYVLAAYRLCGPFRPVVVPPERAGDDVIEPMPDLAAADGVRSYGYAQDAYTVRTHTRLTELMQRTVYVSGKPHREMTALVPRVVGQYNRAKAGVDNRVSALLLENQPVMSNMEPGVQLVMQLLQLVFANAFRMAQLVRFVQARRCKTLTDVEQAVANVQSLDLLLSALRNRFPMKVRFAAVIFSFA
jgi:hypothetical protein